MRGRRNPEVHEAAQRALNDGRQPQAVRLLEAAIRKERRRAQRAGLLVQLAEAHLLEGDRQLDLAHAALDMAWELLPAIAFWPEVKALDLEMAALDGAPLGELAGRMADLGEPDSGQASYHAASALLLAGQSDDALELLRKAHEQPLPPYLEWRVWSLAGVALEQLGDFELAAGSIRQALSLAPAGELQELERLALADCLLESGDPAAAARELAVVKAELLERPEDRVFRHWLQARSEQLLGNPSLAVGHYGQALELSHGELPGTQGTPFDRYNLTIALAQLQADLGHFEDSLASYREGLELADPAQLSLVRHEFAVTLIESGDAEVLGQVAADESYEWRPEALAELADLRFRDGDNDGARELANRALAIRPVAAAYLCLGSIAMEYWRLQEAVDWFSKAADTAGSGDPTWLAAQQLLADTYAQMGPDNADRLFLHAQTALKYTDSRNDWYLPLRRHVEAARRTLAGTDRLVN